MRMITVFQVHGKATPGPLFDIGMLMYHNGRTLLDIEGGPFFYLPKVKLLYLQVWKVKSFVVLSVLMSL